MITDRRHVYDFDDIFISPGYSDVNSGEESLVPTKQFNGITLTNPIISSPMDSVTSSKMMEAMFSLGGLGIHHRYMEPSDVLESIGDKIPRNHVFVSVGTLSSHREKIDMFLRNGIVNFCIDVAHGASLKALDTITYLKEHGAINIISGSVCTSKCASLCIDRGANAIRIGVSSGQQCVTRLATGIGLPLAYAISEVYSHFFWTAGEGKYISISQEDKTKYGKAILIADGGIRNPSDICKALLFGADYVFLGTMLAGTEESCSELEILKENPNLSDEISNQMIDHLWYNTDINFLYPRKIVRGMASREALVGGNGKNHTDCMVEGKSSYVPYTGKVEIILNRIKAAIQQSMYYVGAKDLTLYRKMAQILVNE